MHLLNITFHLIHVGIILFCLLAWLSPDLLIYHLILCILTLSSWFVIGYIVKKPGICIITAIQQKLRKHVNTNEVIENYVHFLLKSITGKDIDPKKVDLCTAISLYILTLLSIILNYRVYT